MLWKIRKSQRKSKLENYLTKIDIRCLQTDDLHIIKLSVGKLQLICKAQYNINSES